MPSKVSSFFLSAVIFLFMPVDNSHGSKEMFNAMSTKIYRPVHLLFSFLVYVHFFLSLLFLTAFCLYFTYRMIDCVVNLKLISISLSFVCLLLLLLLFFYIYCANIAMLAVSNVLLNHIKNKIHTKIAIDRCIRVPGYIWNKVICICRENPVVTICLRLLSNVKIGDFPPLG